MRLKVDSHQHFWKLSRGDYGWLKPDNHILFRDFQPDDLLPHLKDHQIDKTIVVQAAQTMEETEYLLKLYEQHDFIAGVVGWIEMDADDFKEHFTRFQKHKGFVGLRPMLHEIEDDLWILRPRVKENLSFLIEHDFPIDILIFPRHLPYILEILDEFPQLRAVIDHIAKPHITRRELEPWKSQMSKIATYEKIMCKLSGMITEADPEHWKEDDLKPYISHLIDIFGPRSVMFGSDWPVCLLAGSYKQVHDALVNNLPKHLTEEEIRFIFGGNAFRFYNIEETVSSNA